LSPRESELAELYRKRTEYLGSRVFGLDLNPALVRAAKMNMVMNNDGEGRLFQANSLTNQHAWNPEAAKGIPLGSIDVLFTNPPFGANIIIDGEDVLSQFDLAAVWDKRDDNTWAIRIGADGQRVLQKSQPPEILFIERCVQFLVDGTGRMAMVIPNGILNNPALAYVRQWMMQNTQIIAVVDMARELFQPKNDTQTSMVLMRRLSAKERRVAVSGKLDYAVFMAVTEKIGHDKRGQAIFRQAPNGDDIVALRDDEIIEFDPQTGERIVRTVQIKDRVVDDELPEVSAAYRQWLENIK
jgi:type I restriction enzyme M protein